MQRISFGALYRWPLGVWRRRREVMIARRRAHELQERRAALARIIAAVEPERGKHPVRRAAK